MRENITIALSADRLFRIRRRLAHQRDLELSGTTRAYGEKLMPILADTGIEFSHETEIFEVHNLIKR